MGDVPVLAHGDKKLSQSAVILNYLAKRLLEKLCQARG
jgi:glutathione S-transferase